VIYIFQLLGGDTDSKLMNNKKNKKLDVEDLPLMG
jgi:hypothetical protein